MLDRMVEKVRQQKVFCHEDTPLCRRVLAAFLSTLDCDIVESDCSLIDTTRRFSSCYRLKQLFEPDRQDRQEVAIEAMYIWGEVDCETLEVLAVEVPPDRSRHCALLFLKDYLELCRGRLLVQANSDPWYDWLLNLLDCDQERETWRTHRDQQTSSYLLDA